MFYDATTGFLIGWLKKSNLIEKVIFDWTHSEGDAGQEVQRLPLNVVEFSNVKLPEATSVHICVVFEAKQFPFYAILLRSRMNNLNK